MTDIPESIYDFRAGDLGFSTIGGRTGWWVGQGMAALGDACRYTHAYLCLGNGDVIEAMPHGARIRKLSAWDWQPGFAYARLNMTDAQRHTIFANAPRYEGTPYSFLDYLALAVKVRRRVDPPSAGSVFAAATPRPAAPLRSKGPTWLDRYVTDSGHMICSQLVDHILAVSGVHLFNDGRLHQDVTPGDLFYWCAENATLIFPHERGADVNYPGENLPKDL
jgi:hypothetical protein